MAVTTDSRFTGALREDAAEVNVPERTFFLDEAIYGTACVNASVDLWRKCSSADKSNTYYVVTRVATQKSTDGEAKCSRLLRLCEILLSDAAKLIGLNAVKAEDDKCGAPLIIQGG